MILIDFSNVLRSNSEEMLPLGSVSNGAAKSAQGLWIACIPETVAVSIGD